MRVLRWTRVPRRRLVMVGRRVLKARLWAATARLMVARWAVPVAGPWVEAAPQATVGRRQAMAACPPALARRIKA